MSTESDKYFNEFINLEGDCNCDECKADRLYDRVLELFIYFGVSFIPIEFEQDVIAHKYSVDEYTFSHFWECTLDGLKRYNEKMERKKDESGTNKSLVNCIQCGRLTYKNKNRIYNDNQLCLSCAGKYKECDYCHRLFNSERENVSKLIIIENDGKETIEYACSFCYRANKLEEKRCQNCGKYSRDLDKMAKMITKRDNNDNILSTNYCTACSYHIHKCETLGCKELTTSYNRTCRACEEDESGLMPYDFKPIRRRFNYSSNEKNIDINTSLFFGFEIEVEAESSKLGKETMALLIKEVVGKDYVYCMKDGSLSNGIEIASYPYTWDWYKKEGKEKWTNMLLYLKSKGWRAEFDNSHPVGLHVHTTKAAWSNLQIYKLIQFVYNPINRKFMNDVAGRGPMTYCQISSSDYDRSIKLAKDKKNVSNGHYNMINLNRKDDTTKGGKTIEFRMFKGSLEPYTVHKNLEFVQAIFMYTRDNPKKSMFNSAFKKYVLSNSKEYPCLFEFITNLIKKGR